MFALGIIQYDLEVRGPGQAGGLIFYDKGSYSDGWRYLEAAPASTEWTLKVWGGYGTAVTGADGTAIGTGQQNTIDIVTEYGTSEPYEGKTDYAAKLCNDLSYNGYSDWFLPSEDELNMIYNNLRSYGVGGFDELYYWSSSEYDAERAWYQNFGSSLHFISVKSTGRTVRAVRAF